MKYQNYIWDLGGTLLDNYELSAQAFAAALYQRAKRSVLHEEIYAALKVSTDEAIARFAADIPNFRRDYKKLEARSLAHPRLFKDAAKVLASLQADGAQHFLVSHRNAQVLDILETAGIAQYFTKVITSDDGYPRKPDPTSFLAIINGFQLPLSETVAIGDRPIDIKAGQAAGIATIFFDKQQINPEATYSIHELKEILSL